MNNSSTYIGFMPRAKLGIVILANRGEQVPNEIGRRILWELARDTAEADASSTISRATTDGAESQSVGVAGKTPTNCRLPPR